MDSIWFKEQQKKAGVTAQDIADRAGRDRSVVSHIYAGRQKMSLEWAAAFADAFGTTVDEVLRHAGALPEQRSRELRPGFSESDAAPFTGQGAQEVDTVARAVAFGGGKPGIDTWEVRTGALSLDGYLIGDIVLVDTHQSELCRAGDVVIAQKYDAQSGTAATLLRRYEPPVLVAANTAPEDRRVHVVDGTNVVIRGKVIASWRA